MWRRGPRAIKFVVFALAALGVLAAAVMLLWNALMPTLFGLHVLSFGQALGLLVLARLLFGRFGRPGGWGAGGPGWRGNMMQRWQRMTPQEREQLRSRWRCGDWDEPAPQAGAEAPPP